MSLTLSQARFSLRNWPGSTFQKTGRINSQTKKIGSYFINNAMVHPYSLRGTVHGLKTEAVTHVIFSG
ncbi:hypothetical protein [Ruegeria sp. THAF33]|uniref:hypothetical protein n=1 Tax=Ruegeria sp. THAF33 TaxID=2587853 RepID=UPI00156295F0|nr:hypothetical protein [Ruegeria sp. THAF33]